MMLLTNNEAKAKANILTRFMAEQGVTLPSSQMLNAIARMANLEDWNALAVKFTPDSVDNQLLDIELEHARASVNDAQEAKKEGVDPWPNEIRLQVSTGFYVAFAGYPEPISYIRVCDPLGREVAYWSEDEFTDDAPEVLGALFGALSRGKSDMMPDPVTPSADKVVFASRATKPVSTLSSVDWDNVISIGVTQDKDEGFVVASYTLRHLFTDCMEELDAEAKGVASNEQLAYLDDEAESFVIDWGDEYEAEGLRVKDFRGYRRDTAQRTWTLADGRELKFFEQPVAI